MANINVSMPHMDAQFYYMEAKRMQVEYGILQAESMATGDKQIAVQCENNLKRLEKYVPRVTAEYRVAFN